MSKMLSRDYETAIAKLQELTNNLNGATLEVKDNSKDEHFPCLTAFFFWVDDSGYHNVSIHKALKGGLNKSTRIRATAQFRSRSGNSKTDHAGGNVWGFINGLKAERKRELIRWYHKGMIEVDECVWNGKFISYLWKEDNGYFEGCPVEEQHNLEAIRAKGVWTVVEPLKLSGNMIVVEIEKEGE